MLNACLSNYYYFCYVAVQIACHVYNINNRRLYTKRKNKIKYEKKEIDVPMELKGKIEEQYVR